MDSIHPLRRWRREHNVTLAELAGREGVEVSPSHLSEIERGLNTLSLDLAASLSRATGGKVKVEEFVRQEAAKRPVKRVRSSARAA